MVADGGSLSSFVGSSARIQSQREEIRKLLHDFIRASADINTRLQKRLQKSLQLVHSLQAFQTAAETDGQQDRTKPDWSKLHLVLVELT